MAITNGAANSAIGFSSEASDWPDVNHTIISLSRYQRVTVSSTVRNSATASRMLR